MNSTIIPSEMKLAEKEEGQNCYHFRGMGYKALLKTKNRIQWNTSNMKFCLFAHSSSFQIFSMFNFVLLQIKNYRFKLFKSNLLKNYYIFPAQPFCHYDTLVQNLISRTEEMSVFDIGECHYNPKPALHN